MDIIHIPFFIFEYPARFYGIQGSTMKPRIHVWISKKMFADLFNGLV